MTKNQLSKICINCNLQKPLTAYLQITGPHGSSYGNVCSTCRGSGLGKKVVIPEIEDTGSSSSSTGLKIDAKAKLQADLEKKEALDKRKEEEKKEREELDLKNVAEENRKTAKFEKEDKHRKEFLEPNKAKSFLDYQSKKPEDKRAGLEKRTMDEMFQHDEEAKVENRIKGFDDLSVTRIDPTQTGTIKNSSAVWKQFRTLLGGSAGVNIIEGQMENEPNRRDALLEPNNMDVTKPNDTHPHKKDFLPSQTSTIEDQHNHNSSKKTMFNTPSKREDLVKYVEKNFENEKPTPTSPGTGGRRR